MACDTALPVRTTTMSTRAPRRYLQLDVFADRPGAGNALGVVLVADTMTSASMQAFAAWTNLSETIFLLQPTSNADYRVRIFTPRQELPFAGHPSVGAAWAAIDACIADSATLLQECAAGLLPVRVDGQNDKRVIHVRAPTARPQTVDARIAPLLSAALQDAILGTQPPALWSNGPGFWLVELRDAQTVRTLMPDLSAITTLTNASGAVGFAVYGRPDPLDAREDADLVVRVFCPADNIPEDPVTGSANACIGALLASTRALPGANGRYRASQGREVGRDGIVEVEVDASGEIWIGGRVQRVIDGCVAWPDDMAVGP